MPPDAKPTSHSHTVPQLASAPSTAPSSCARSRPATSPPALAPPADDGHEQDTDDDDEEDDEDDIESLLYLAQLDLISHRTEEAERRLERAAGAGSTAACATLAGILARKSRVASPTQATDPTSVPAPSSSLSPPSSTSVLRPALPARTSSSSSSAQTLQGRSPDALRAVELSLTGLALLLQKPIRPSGGSGHLEAESDDEDSAEGRFFDLERAMDLVAKVTNAHRFGVLHAPTPNPQQMRSPSVDGSAANDDLWARSAVAAARLLDHEVITELFQQPPQPSQPPFLSRSGSSRSSSVSRSFAHPSSTLPIDSKIKGTAASLLTPERKLKVTIAIHALYVLALQAWAAHSPSSPTARPSAVGEAAASIESDPRQLAERYWSIIDRLAQPYAALGGIGIKEGDEIVLSTQRRLESLYHKDLGAEEPWRLAKKRGRRNVSPAVGPAPGAVSPRPTPTPDAGSSAVTIRPALEPRASTSSGSFGGRTPRASAAMFHFGADVEEADEEDGSSAARSPTTDLSEADTAVSRSPHAALPPSPDTHLLSPSKAGSPSQGHGTPSQPYPSPPETPPIGSATRSFVPDQPAPRAGSSSLSPRASSSRLQPLVSPHATSTDLPRVTSTRSIASNRSTASVLSTFKHDPLQAYLSGRLRRVTSSASVCTAPPDLSGRTRICRGKGKGKMVEPEPSELFDFGAGGRGAASLERARSRPSLATVEETDRPKTWLSRFWKTSRASLEKVPGLAAAAEEGALDRTRSSSAMHALKKALDRHDEANSSVVLYWGEGEHFDEEDAEELDVDDEGRVLVPVPADTGASPPPHQAQASLRFDEAQLSQVDKLRSSLSAKQEPSTRQAARQRSFLLTDPTSNAASPSGSASRTPSRSRRARRTRQASAGSSASSTHSTTADGHLAPPSPRKGGASRRRRLSSASVGTPGEVKSVPMDPLLLELERRSHIGLKTACAACGKRGLNFPACRKCKGTYCSRECRVGLQHVCRRAAAAAVVQA